MLTDQERELETLDIHVNVGPQHPATHGVFRMVLTVSGEKVVDVVPHIGYMHRGAEKLSEGMDYRQALIYQDRTEYLAQFNAELCYCLAVEKLAGLEVPERAEYIRVILTELNRITSHYMFVGAFATDIGVYGTAFTYAFREREYIQEIFDAVSGDRMMYGYFRPGGVVWDVTDDFKDRVRWVCGQTRVGIDDIDRLLTKNEIFLTRCLDIGVISKEDAIDYGLSGPMLRACGLPFDLRRAEPYSIYDRFQFDIPTGTRGDVYDRYLVRMEEMRQSVRIVEQALEEMPDGPIMPEKAPRRLRLPPGEVYMRTENPRGEYGIYLVSKGGEKPYRLKIRSSCLSNLTALKQMVVGHYVADAVVILGSVDIVLGEVDR
ncbi:MAG: NADH-quinone oxidoreductase subunit D [Dehalococcoidia bacterium]|jgi:NADH:ubiquinone oxidoreductase subunit D|nr:NADH-quinone oxidoreductase subunit D [Dehalococcoidia bacterium]